MNGKIWEKMVNSIMLQTSHKSIKGHLADDLAQISTNPDHHEGRQL